MKILLLGPSGQVGWELQRALAPLGELVLAGRQGSGDWAADLNRPDELLGLVEKAQPDWIVNAAAYTAVDLAEDEPDVAQRVNGQAVGALAQAALAVGASLLHYSSDYVFDGSGSQPWSEDAPTGPLSVYGRSKLAGEELARDSGCRHVILRTSWVYAARGGNFARTMLRLAAQRERLSVVGDQIGAPTGADLIADVSAHVIRAASDRGDLLGTYHLAAAGETSWHAYATYVIEWARRHDLPVAVAPDGIAEVATSAYPTRAQRPLNSRLSTLKLEHAFGLTLPPWQAGVERMLTEAFL